MPTFRSFGLSFAFCCLAFAPLAIAQQLSSSPYLTELSPNSVTICWMTKANVQDFLWLHDGKSERKIQSDAATRFHHVRLHDLAPDTQYRYRTQGGSWQRFSTPDRERHFLFTVLGHTGGSKHEFPDPQNFKLARLAELRPDFVVHCGDSVYYASPDAYAKELISLFEPIVSSRPIFLAAANHEAGWPNTYGLDYRAMRQVFPYPYADGDVPYYRIDYKHASLFMLAQISITDFDCEQLKWLEKELRACNSEFKIVVLGGHSLSYRLKMKSSEFIDRISRMIAPLGVDLLLGGDGPGDLHNINHGVPYYYTGAGNYFRSVEVSEYGLYIRRHDHLGNTSSKHRYFSKRTKTKVYDLLQHPKQTTSGFKGRTTISSSRPSMTFSELSTPYGQVAGIRLKGVITPKGKKGQKRVGIYVYWKPVLSKLDKGAKEKWYRIQSVPFQTGGLYEVKIPFPKEVPLIGRPYRFAEIWLQFRTDASRVKSIDMQEIELFR